MTVQAMPNNPTPRSAGVEPKKAQQNGAKSDPSGLEFADVLRDQSKNPAKSETNNEQSSSSSPDQSSQQPVEQQGQAQQTSQQQNVQQQSPQQRGPSHAANASSLARTFHERLQNQTAPVMTGVPQALPVQNQILEDDVKGEISPAMFAQKPATQDSSVSDQLTDVQASVDEFMRGLAMVTFLKKMKSELGVEPEKLVEAFTKLSLQDLRRPPEDNIRNIVQQLGLNDSQQEKARNLLSELLQITEAKHPLKGSGEKENATLALVQMQLAQMNNPMANLPMAQQLPQQLPQQRITPQQFLQQQLQAARGDQNLAMNNDSKQDQRAAVAAFGGSVPAAQSLFSAQQAAGATAAMNPAATPLAAGQAFDIRAITQQAQPKGPAVDDVADGSDLESDSVASASVAANSANGIAIPKEMVMSTAATHAPVMDPQMMAQMASRQMAHAQAVATKSMKPVMSSPSGSGLAQGQQGMEASAGGDVAAGDAGATSFAAQQAMAGSQKQTNNIVGAQGLQAAGNNQQHAATQNVNDIINQAQIMIKKGGGEMKIQLQPEGLGEVSMRVKVQGGQVSVEMLTQNNDAKRILEKGIGDLKATLSSHQLDIGSIKVDLAKDASKFYDQQREQAQRHFAQQFLEDFRQNNQQSRQELYDIPGFSERYKSQTRDLADNMYLQPRAKGASRRLDLVA